MDMKLAFLTGALEEEVYVEQPSSFFIGKEDQVFALNKALYGLTGTASIVCEATCIAEFYRLHTQRP
jgi:hypothetical protein